MAVATNYSLNSVAGTGLTRFANASEVDITSLSNGGIGVTCSHNGHTDVEMLDANLVLTGDSLANTGTKPAIDQLSNGNVVIVTQDEDSIRFTVQTRTGAIVIATTDLGDIDSSNADVAGVGTGFWIVAQDELGAAGGDADIDVYRRNADGSFAGFFTVAFTANRDTNASIAALDNGNVVIAWQRDNGANTEIWYAIYTASGGTVVGPTLADGVGTINRNVSATALDGGGFALVYEDNGWFTGSTEITLATFNSAGNILDYDNVSNSTFGSSDETNPYVTRLENGLLAVAYSSNFASDPDVLVSLVDPVTGAILANDNIAGGEPLTDDADFGAVAGYGTGRIAVYFSNLTDGDVDGEALEGRRTSVSDAASDTIMGDDFVDRMFGGGGNDRLFGNANDDDLRGGAGNDLLVGGIGRDVLIGNGDRDRFDFNSTAESGVTGATRDSIIDFEAGTATTSVDRIDVSTIDANTGLAGNQDFIFGGAFTAGHMRAVQSGANVILQFNTDADAAPEMAILLRNVSAANLGVNDFIL